MQFNNPILFFLHFAVTTNLALVLAMNTFLHPILNSNIGYLIIFYTCNVLFIVNQFQDDLFIRNMHICIDILFLDEFALPEC